MMMPQRMPMMTRLVGNNSRACMTRHSADVAAAAGRCAVRPAPGRAGAAGRRRRHRRPASAGLAATLYASHCTDDLPLFVATWYTIATALVTAIGALVGSRVLKY